MSRRALTWAFATVALLLAAPTFAADTVYYYSSDTLHSEVVVTDQNRNVVERTHYAPYGQVLDRDLRDGPGYTGHAEDPETGLVYMQQRYYDSEAGRFLSVDPVQADGGGGSFNRYWYANDNPYRYTDPDGRNITTFLGGLAVESWHAVTGQGFNGTNLVGALEDGYNGEGEGRLAAAFQDATTIIPDGAIAGAAVKVFRLVKIAKAAKLAAKLPTIGKEGSKGVREVVGAVKDAKKMFNTLRGTNKAKEVKEGVLTAKGANGGTVTFRASSKSGPPTVDVHGVIDGVRKIKFKDH